MDLPTQPANRLKPFGQTDIYRVGSLEQSKILYVSGSTITGIAVSEAGALTNASQFVQASASFYGTSASGTISSNAISVSIGAYITTARRSTDAIGLNTAQTNVTWTVNSSGLSLNASRYAGTGFTSTTTAGTAVVGTNNTLGLSVGVPAFITTAMASNRGSDFVAATAAFAGTSASGTIASNGISVSIGPYLTTAMASNRGSDFVQATAAFAGTSASGTIASNGISVSIGPYLTTAALSNHSHGNPTLNLTNLSGTTASNSAGLTLSLSAADAGGGATMSVFEPFYLMNATATTTHAAQTVYLQHISAPAALTFGQVNAIGSMSLSQNGGNTLTENINVTDTGARSNAISYGASHSASAFMDLFLFSRGSGGYSTEIETIASTRNTFITQHALTLSASLTKGAGVTYSVSYWQSLNLSLSYPAITSDTVTSVNAASTFTTWGTGYSLFTISTTSSISTSYGALTSNSLSMSAYPLTTAWSSNKMVLLNFASSLSAGNHWIGLRTASSTSSSTASGNTGQARLTLTYTSAGMNSVIPMTVVGNTNTIASSLGWLGQASQATMAPSPGEGFFGTYDPGSTYLNNAGNPNGALAFTQISSHTSFFKTWLQFASNRI